MNVLGAANPHTLVPDVTATVFEPAVQQSVVMDNTGQSAPSTDTAFSTSISLLETSVPPTTTDVNQMCPNVEPIDSGTRDNVSTASICQTDVNRDFLMTVAPEAGPGVGGQVASVTTAVAPDLCPSSCSSNSTIQLMIDQSPTLSQVTSEKECSPVALMDTGTQNAVAPVTEKSVSQIDPSVVTTSESPHPILPTLIEPVERAGEPVIPAIQNLDKNAEQPPLSFPNVSQDQESAVIPVSPKNFDPDVAPVTSDDPLRTPPRPMIEDKTAATEENIAPLAPPAAIPPPVVPVAPLDTGPDLTNDAAKASEPEGQTIEMVAQIKMEKLESVDPCCANGDEDRLDLKIEKMKQDDKSPLPGHASDHRVINYHSGPQFGSSARSFANVPITSRSHERRVYPHVPVPVPDFGHPSQLIRQMPLVSHNHHQQNPHHMVPLTSAGIHLSNETENAVLNLARSSYDTSSTSSSVLYDSFSPYHQNAAHSSLHRAAITQRSSFPPNPHSSHYLMTPYHQRPVMQTPTSIPVSVVTSGSEHLRKMSAISSANSSGIAVMNQLDRNIIMNGHLYRNNTAGRRPVPSSIISTGTRTTSRQGPSGPNQTNGNSNVISSPISASQHQQSNHDMTSHHSTQQQQNNLHTSNVQQQQMAVLLPANNMALMETSSNNSSNGVNGSSSTTMKPPPVPSGDPSKPFKCPICDKHLASKNVYHLHLRSHNGEKPFACNLCGNAFSQKTSLTRHMRSHTGERPFSCQVCAKRFADKERIKIHMRTHTGEKPFSCEVCRKQFSQKSTVKRHMSVHTGEKPWKCKHCGKGFANRGNLVAHEKTHSSPSASSSHPSSSVSSSLNHVTSLSRTELLSPESSM